MKNKTVVLTGLVASILFFSGIHILAQNNDCTVKMPEISDDYSGGCKKGLAHGRGVAQGVDHYEGQFLEGLPHGTGRYTWSNGTYYEGQWRYGQRDGRGTLVSKDSTVTGFWKNNTYVGKELLRSYQITRSMSIARSTIVKLKSPTPGVRIRIMLGGTENTEVEDLIVAYNSGQEYRTGGWIGIQNPVFPLDVKVTYRTWNQLHSVQYNAIFEFTINEPGMWEVMIAN